MDQQRTDDVVAARSPGMDRRTVLKGIGAGATAVLLAAAGPAVRHGAAQEATPGAAPALFLVIRRYRLAPGAAPAEVVRRTEEGFVPIIRQVTGFVEYYNVELGNGEGATISVFSSQAGAEESTARAAAWVTENLAELLAGPPEVAQGPVLLHATAEETARLPAAGAALGGAAS